MLSLDTALIIQRNQQTGFVIRHEDETCDDTYKSRSTFKTNVLCSPTQYSLTNMRMDAFHDRYNVVEKIGNGSMGIISAVQVKADKLGGSAYECKCKGFFGYGTGRKRIVTARKDRPKCNSSYQYALKTLQTSCSTSNYVDELHNEVTVLRSCDHPNIIKAIEVYESKTKRDLTNQIHLVLELCTGGDLFSRSPYSRREAAEIASKVINAINYMHQRNIVHRDIKYENILFESEESSASIKIIDFGLSKCLVNQTNPEKICDRVGTTYTMAPEVLRRGYTSQADMWSVGVVAYMLLSGQKPFKSKSRSKTIDMILEGSVKYDAPIWADETAKDFVCRLLVVDPKHRMTAAAASCHKWLLHREILPEEEIDIDVLRKIGYCLRQYVYQSDFKKIALTVIAHRTIAQQVHALRTVFTRFDTNHNGILAINDLKDHLRTYFNFSCGDIDSIVSSIDFCGRGHITYTDFLAATLESVVKVREDQVAEAFDRLDCDSDGYISKCDLLLSAGQYPKHQLISLIQSADNASIGKVSYQDFCNHFRQLKSSKQVHGTVDTTDSTFHEIDFASQHLSDDGMCEL